MKPSTLHKSQLNLVKDEESRIAILDLMEDRGNDYVYFDDLVKQEEILEGQEHYIAGIKSYRMIRVKDVLVPICSKKELELKKVMFETRINETFNFYLATSETLHELYTNFEKEGQELLNEFNKETGLNKGFRFRAFADTKMKFVKWSEHKKNRG